MPNPKKRMSPVRSGNRRRNIGLDLPSTTKCPSCNAVMVRHQACPSCGHYRGRLIVPSSVPTLKRSK